MKITPRTFDGPRRNGRASEFPYLFHREPADVIEEAFSELLHQRTRPVKTAVEGDHEQEAVREQRWTLFAHDEAMQQVFSGDFDAFCAALDDPKRMDERLREARRRIMRGASKVRGASAEPEHFWGPSHEHEHVHTHDNHEHASLDDDPVYDAAFRWACRAERWSRRLYFAQNTRDRDLFRVFLNAPLVPAKVAFAFFGALGDDLAGHEVALIGYRQATIFLGCTMDSLANCYGRRIGREQTAHALLDEGRELLADLESKLAEIETEIRRRGGRRKNP
ncbi:MAG: hypothetical protein Q8R16_05055 [bacterium]|nr:hypothetical protein [bacterium]